MTGGRLNAGLVLLVNRHGVAVHTPIELLIVEPHPAMRGALSTSLDREEGMRVAALAGDMRAALRAAAKPGVTMAIVAGGLVGLGSPLALEALRALARRVPVVVMGFGQPARYAPAYVAAGASGYWAKDGDVAGLLALLRTAAERRRPAA
jgi:DNA-binding NarL/FixJ family response regulator